MKGPTVILAMVAAVLVQAVLARYTGGGGWTFDVVLVSVIYVALQRGPVVGCVCGTVGGLAADLLSGGIVGVGGLTKTVLGFLAGQVGTQFVIARPSARMVIVAVCTVLHRLAVACLYGLIDQRWPGVAWTAMLVEAGVNALAVLAIFHVTTTVPGVLSRRRTRRATYGRR